MNDDEKMNDGKVVSEESENKAENTAADESKEMGKVIPFDPKVDTNAALDAAQSALNDAVANMKTAFSDLKKQMAPLADTLREVKTAINEGAQNAKAAAEAQAAERKAKADAEGSDEPKAEDATASAAREAAEVINLGLDKLKKRAANLNFNLKDVLSRELENYADKNLSEDDFTLDENGKRVIKVDGKFMQAHGNEVVPALLRGTVGSFLKAILGSDPIKDAEKKTENGEDATETAKIADIPEADTNEPSKYRVEFDFAEALGNAIRNAQVTPAAQTEDEVHSREQGREVLIESARIVEDSLNGKSTDDAKERLEAATKRVDMDDADKAPEDIEAVDEKHQKILEMSRQFEKNMNSDK